MYQSELTDSEAGRILLMLLLWFDRGELGNIRKGSSDDEVSSETSVGGKRDRF